MSWCFVSGAVVEFRHVLESMLQHNHKAHKYKVGLVLAGGGAKGAYQIGVWKALQEKGIEVDVVSGSSIGALNATLIVSGDWAKANELWLKLSTLQLVRLSPFFLLSFILNFIHALGNTFISVSDSAYIGSPTPAVLNRRRSVVITPVSIFILVLVGCVFSYLKVDKRLALFTVIFLAIPMLAAAIADYLNLSILRPASLNHLLNNAVDWKAITDSQIPIHVTIARWTFRYAHPMIAMIATLPDNPRATEFCDPKQVEYIRRTRWRAHDGVELAPFYPILNERTTDEAKAHVLASMAFPAGVLGKVKIGKFRYMDGGAFDNTPIYPLLPYQCEKILVVLKK